MALEGDPVVVHLARIRQRKDLVAARIGEDGRRPAHKAVQPTHLSHQLVARAQVQVVGVSQHQAGANLFELLGGNGFDRGLGTYRGEGRGEDRTVGGVEDASAGSSLLSQDFEGE